VGWVNRDTRTLTKKVETMVSDWGRRKGGDRSQRLKTPRGGPYKESGGEGGGGSKPKPRKLGRGGTSCVDWGGL